MKSAQKIIEEVNKCLSLKTFSHIMRDWKTSIFALFLQTIYPDKIPQAC